MIPSSEALALVPPTEADLAQARSVLAKIDQHLRHKMTFAGPEALEIQPDKLSYTAAKIVAVMMKRFGWNASMSLGVKQSALGGQQTIWQCLFSPVIEVYEAALVDFEIDPRPLLQ